MMRAAKVLLVLALLATAHSVEAKKDKNNDNNNNNGGNNKGKSNTDKSPTPSPTPSPSPSSSPSPSPSPSPEQQPAAPEQPALCRTHTVQPGDNAQSLSAEYGVRYEDVVAALAQCIGYVEGSFLNVGQAVCLPPYTPACVHVAPVSPDNARCKVYTVQAGDTMASLSASFGVSTAELVELNGGAEAAAPGQRLKLPPWGDACPGDLSAGDEPCRVFRARAGDTLAAIATGFRTTVDKLVAVNSGFSATTALGVGQPVRIPPYGESCGAGRVVAAFPTDGVTVCRSYRVAAGDSVYSIALAFGAASADLVGLNPELANPSMLALGAAIKIPPWDDSCTAEGVAVAKPGGSATGAPAPAASAPPSSRLPVTGASPSTAPAPVASPPAPVVVTPSAPVPVTPASNATGTPAAQKSKLELLVVGATKEEFAVKQQAVVTSLAAAAGVSPTNVTITYVLAATPPARRLLQAGDAVKVQAVVTGDPGAVQSNLEGADRAGTLAASFQVLGMTLNTLTFIAPTGESTVIVAAPAPAAAVDSGDDWPLPIPLGAVVGAAAGLAVLLVAAAWLCCCLSKRRRRRAAEAAAAGPGLKRYPSGVNAYVTTTNSGSLSGKKGARSPPRSPQRGGPRSASRTRALNSEVFVLSTAVSTPRYDDCSSGLPSSQPPSSAASMADTLEEKETPVVVSIAEQQQQQQQPEQQQLSPRESVVSSPGAPSFGRVSSERRPSGGTAYASPYSQRAVPGSGSGSGSARGGTYVSPYSQRRLRSSSSSGSPTAAGGSARRAPVQQQRSRLASYAEV